MKAESVKRIRKLVDKRTMIEEPRRGRKVPYKRKPKYPQDIFEDK